MVKIILNAFGNDKTGLVSEISGIVSSQNGNILESKMVKINTMFSAIMVISVPKQNKNNLIDKINNIKELNVFIDNIKSEKQIIEYNNYLFNLECADNEGIIYYFTDYLQSEKINILKMETTTVNAPITGITLFQLDSIISIPNKLEINKLKLKLNSLSEKYNVTYKLLFKSK
tara:strand:+ start:1463 stop:1981 length:519 start_codon:yes stop_codon:yes gene_type:complete